MVTDRQTDRQTDTDRQTGRQTDRQTDESDFIGCCITNVECPTKSNNESHQKKKKKKGFHYTVTAALNHEKMWEYHNNL